MSMERLTLLKILLRSRIGSFFVFCKVAMSPLLISFVSLIPYTFTNCVTPSGESAGALNHKLLCLSFQRGQMNKKDLPPQQHHKLDQCHQLKFGCHQQRQRKKWLLLIFHQCFNLCPDVELSGTVNLIVDTLKACPQIRAPIDVNVD